MVWVIVILAVLASALIFTPSRRTIIRSCREFDRIVTTNCEENELDCKRRMDAVREELSKMDVDSIADVEKYIIGLDEPLSSIIEDIEKEKIITPQSYTINSTNDNAIKIKPISHNSLKPDGPLQALCLAAVEKDGLNLQFVPDELRTLELCLVALQKNCLPFEFVPEQLRETEEICVAVVSDPFALATLPHELKSLRICILAVRKHISNLEFVPDEFKTDDFLDASGASSRQYQRQYSGDDDDYGRYAYGEFNEFGFRIEK